MHASNHHSCRRARDLDLAKEQLVANGIPIVDRIRAHDDGTVELFLRRTIVYSSNDRHTITSAEWLPFRDLFAHAPVAISALERALGRSLAPTSTS